jgi:hypothetical protein
MSRCEAAPQPTQGPAAAVVVVALFVAAARLPAAWRCHLGIDSSRVQWASEKSPRREPGGSVRRLVVRSWFVSHTLARAEVYSF